MTQNAPSTDPLRGARVSQAIRECREAQAEWSGVALRDRLALVRRLRHRIAAEPDRLAASIRLPQRLSAESLSGEVLPLADACRFLEREAGRALAPRRFGRRGRPLWLYRTSLEIRRDPVGLVLVIAPWNYPLLLAGVQVIQALTAGNGVILKPGRRSSAAAEALAEMVYEAGFDRRLLQVLPETVEAAQAAITAGVDKVVLTGSASTGQAVFGQLAQSLTPMVMELSGCDGAFVREDADLDLVVDALVFGARLNGGATCIAPRRVFVHQSVATALEERLVAAFRKLPPLTVDRAAAESAAGLIHGAIEAGARLVAGRYESADVFQPVLLAGARPEMKLLQSDVFVPMLALVPVADDETALAASTLCPYGLGASVFGRSAAAERLARRVDAGCVVVNDIIVPTADPRMPFGGRRQSGFGTTRGLEGLLEFTAIKAVAMRRSRWLPHLKPLLPADEDLIRGYLRLVHGATLAQRLRAVIDLVRALAARRRNIRDASRGR